MNDWFLIFRKILQTQIEAQQSTRKGHAAAVGRQSRQRLRDGFDLERKKEPTDMELSQIAEAECGWLQSTPKQT
ncbi:MAG: hypothetical protein ACI4O0_07405 [Candidatus Limivicinus sp.]